MSQAKDKFDDESIKERLKELDEDEFIELESHEASLVETLLFKQTFSFTAKQTSFALNILEKYGK